MMTGNHRPRNRSYSLCFVCLVLWLWAGTSPAGQSAVAPGRVYFVDGEKGDDSNVGTGPAEAWRSVDRANRVDYEPGDQLLFAGGQACAGTLTFQQEDSGTPERPIRVSTFGTGRAAIWSGKGSGFQLHDCAHVTVANLAFAGCGRRDGNDGNGVELLRTRFVALDALEVSGFRLSGIATAGDEHTRITRVDAHDNGFAGISTDPLRGGGPRAKDLYIGHCVARNNPGDPKNLTNHSGNGIVVGGVDGALVEYCEAFDNGWDMPRQGNGPVGIWGWECDRLVIQHCLSHDNKTAAGAADGGGFDLDGGATRSILQYNLSYNNHGCGYLLCQYPGAARWKDNICRYNISVNDGLTNHFSGIYFWAGDQGISDAQVYNNLIINTRRAICTTHDIPGLVFRNNILMADEATIAGPLHRAVFEHNLYRTGEKGVVLRDGNDAFPTLAQWAQATGKEMVKGRLAGLTEDPKLVLPGSLKELPTDPRQLRAMPFYRLQADSSCIGAGVIIADNGGHDFFGNPLDPTSPPALGVHNPP